MQRFLCLILAMHRHISWAHVDLLHRYLNGQPANDKRYEGLTDLQKHVTLDLGSSGEHSVQFFHQHKDQVDWVFVDHPSYHRPGDFAWTILTPWLACCCLG